MTVVYRWFPEIAAQAPKPEPKPQSRRGFDAFRHTRHNRYDVPGMIRDRMAGMDWLPIQIKYNCATHPRTLIVNSNHIKRLKPYEVVALRLGM